MNNILTARSIIREAQERVEMAREVCKYIGNVQITHTEKNALVDYVLSNLDEIALRLMRADSYVTSDLDQRKKAPTKSEPDDLPF